MDLITGLPMSGNKSMIMVVVDKIYKCAHFRALPHPFIPTLVAQSFIKQFFKLHGMMTSILSDHDPTFTIKFWQELLKLPNTQLQILQRVGVVAYKLVLPLTSKIHLVFHVSCLKKVMGNNCRIQTSLPELDEEGSLWFQPDQALDTCEIHLHGYTIKEVLVKWKDTSPEDATWELASILQQFP
eukprot:PITA_33854